jgi:hypothetical protein
MDCRKASAAIVAVLRYEILRIGKTDVAVARPLFPFRRL